MSIFRSSHTATKTGSDETWSFTVRGSADENEEAVASVVAIGNGIVTVRGTVGPAGESPGTFFPGVFDPDEDDASCDPHGGAPALVAAPSWLAFEVHVDGERLAVEGTLDRTLDLRRGLLRAAFTARGRSGPISVEVEQLAASVALLQRIRVTLDDRPAFVAIEAPLLVEPAHPASWRGGRLVLVDADGPLGTMAARAARGSVHVVAMQRLRADDRGPAMEEASIRRTPRGLVHRVTWRAPSGATLVADRRIVVAVDSSLGRARRDVVVRDTRIESDVVAFAEERPAWWIDRWRVCDVRIGGDPRTERAVRLAAYHLSSSAGRAPLGARLHAPIRRSTGRVEDGERFALPFFVFTWPEAARAILRHRHRELPGARERARRQGWCGALYPGDGEDAHHASADVAYAVWQYWCATGDEPFMRDAGVEVLVETAKFWRSRAEKGRDGRFHVRGVAGARTRAAAEDVYTSGMARANLEFADRAFEWLARNDQARARELERALAVNERERERWRAVAAGLHVGIDGPPVEAKHADAVLLCHLLRGRVDAAAIARRIDDCDRRCDPETVWSPAVHASVALHLRRHAAARRALDRAVAIDFEPTAGAPPVDGGIHTAACGGLFQAIAFGALGATATEDALLLAPRLLPEWTSLALALLWRGSRLAFHVTPNEIAVAVTEGLRRVKLRIFGSDLELRPGSHAVFSFDSSEALRAQSA